MPSWTDWLETGFTLSAFAALKALDAVSALRRKKNLNRPPVGNTPLTRREKKAESIGLFKTLIR